ncbi:MAG: ribokinase [Candidatus Limivivens sp.]|nr:ribokinase [Candidatus Limivivens sp.]
MKVLNFGSLNLDFVYAVDHMVGPGETLASSGMQVFCGGKGLNQSVAMAKAGVPVFHAGQIGEDGQPLLDVCLENGVDTSYIRKTEGKGGHTIIQVDKNAQNCILLYGGANRQISREFVDEVLGDFGEGDLLVLQNEINRMDYIIDQAYEKGMRIVLNPSPFDSALDSCDMSKISIFMLNEIEGEQMTGETEAEKILEALIRKYPEAQVVLTLGQDGVIYRSGNTILRQGIFPVKAVDTTAAGDTFTGYFVAGLLDGMAMPQILERCAKASAIAVSRNGAIASIPTPEEVEQYPF